MSSIRVLAWQKFICYTSAHEFGKCINNTDGETGILLENFSNESPEKKLFGVLRTDILLAH